MSNTNAVVVKGKAFYAQVHTPNQLSDAYTVDLAVDDTTAESLEKIGLAAAKRQDGTLVEHAGAEGMKVFKFKKKRVTKDGTVLSKPTVVDSKNNEITDLVGNGSVVRLKVKPYTWTFRGKTGTGGALVAVQVLELVEFAGSGKSSEFDEVDGGFVSKNTPPPFQTDEDVI